MANWRQDARHTHGQRIAATDRGVGWGQGRGASTGRAAPWTIEDSMRANKAHARQVLNIQRAELLKLERDVAVDDEQPLHKLLESDEDIPENVREWLERKIQKTMGKGADRDLDTKVNDQAVRKHKEGLGAAGETIGMAETADMLKVSKRILMSRCVSGEFPMPRKEGGKNVWTRLTVERWIDFSSTGED